MSRSMSVIEKEPGDQKLSLWWRNGVVLVLIFGFSVLIWLTIKTYRDGPPIPNRVVNSAGDTLFTGSDILAGQQVFLSEGLMKVIEWARLPGNIIFAAIGVVPLVIAAGLTYLGMKKPKGDQKYALKPKPNV